MMNESPAAPIQSEACPLDLTPDSVADILAGRDAHLTLDISLELATALRAIVLERDELRREKAEREPDADTWLGELALAAQYERAVPVMAHEVTGRTADALQTLRIAGLL